MPPAGQVSIVLSVNQANYTKAMSEASKKMDAFAGKSKAAGHTTVSSMQAASASIRLLDNPLTMNVRALERFASQSKIVGEVFKAAFPIVGAIAAISVIGKLAGEIADFVKKVNDMPKAIEKGFNSLHLASASATDSLRLTNDELANSIAKLQGKPQNNLAIVLDESRVKADELAKSLEGDADKVKALLEQNKVSSFALLLGKAGTADVSGSVNSFNDQMTSIGGKRAEAVRSGDTSLAADLTKQLADKQNAALDWISKQITLRQATGFGQPNQSANLNILRGFQSSITDSRSLESAKDTNASLVAKQKGAEVAHAAAEKAADARRKEAEELKQSWETDEKYWEMAQEQAKFIAKLAQEDSLSFFKTSGLSSGDTQSLNDAGKSSSAFIQSLRASIDLNKQNSDALALSSLHMAVATGNMSQMDAAQVMANIHLQDYTDALQKLQAQRAAIASSHQYNQDPLGRTAALQVNQNSIDSLNANRQMQMMQDQQNTNPASSSGFVGATNALNDFVLASRDAAKQMSEFTTSAITGLNSVLVNMMSTHSTTMQNRQALGNYGAGLFRNVAGMGLQKAEGSVLGALGFGSAAKLGTQSNPMYVRLADAVSSAMGGIGKLLGTTSSSSDSKASGLGTIISDVIPFLATGGPISGPAIVGELGPELFIPSSNGTIIPNNKLSSGGSGSSGGTTHVNIDARGATDPAQTEAAIHRAIRSAAPHIMAGSLHAMSDRKNRRPSSAG